MCDRYNPEYGYICNECFNELLERARVDNRLDVVAFMDSTKHCPYPQIDIEPYLDQIFPLDA